MLKFFTYGNIHKNTFAKFKTFSINLHEGFFFLSGSFYYFLFFFLKNPGSFPVKLFSNSVKFCTWCFWNKCNIENNFRLTTWMSIFFWSPLVYIEVVSESRTFRKFFKSRQTLRKFFLWYIMNKTVVLLKIKIYHFSRHFYWACINKSKY